MIDIENIAAAIKDKEYAIASELLAELRKDEPENAWGIYYLAALHEAQGKLDAAQRVYRLVLRQTTNPQIIAQARLALHRVEATEQEQKEYTRRQFLTQADSEQPGLLILEPISPEAKKTAVPEFARLMGIDIHAARGQLPTRTLRLYRTGSLGELKYYHFYLRKAQIPSFYLPISDLKTIQVYQVDCFINFTPVPKITYNGHESLSFNWEDVSTTIEAALPLFSSSVDISARWEIQRKINTLDYVRLWDLHLPKKRLILRLCDNHYQFLQNLQAPHQTNAQRWQLLRESIRQNLPPMDNMGKFDHFAPSAMDFVQLLEAIKAQTNIFRVQETPLDAVFELYSRLILWRRGDGRDFHTNYIPLPQ